MFHRADCGWNLLFLSLVLKQLHRLDANLDQLALQLVYICLLRLDDDP